MSHRAQSNLRPKKYEHGNPYATPEQMDRKTATARKVEPQHVGKINKIVKRMGKKLKKLLARRHKRHECSSFNPKTPHLDCHFCNLDKKNGKILTKVAVAGLFGPVGDEVIQANKESMRGKITYEALLQE